MTKKLALFLGVLLLSFTSIHDAKADDFVAFRKRGSEQHRGDQNDNSKRSGRQDEGGFQPSKPGGDDDSAIVTAVNNKRRVDFVEGGGMVVIKLLPDDRNGLEHQKWIVRLSNGETMQAVYNLDLCEYVPLRVGDVVSMGGQFIWTNQGALLHWLHYDPRQNRPDGYVEVNGKVYCGDGQRHN